MATLDKILAFVARKGWNTEIIVVDDGSSDTTVEIVQQYMLVHPELRVIANLGNRGKGYSVRNGILHARGDLILFTDADLSSPITEADKLIAAIANGADIAIGSRWLRSDLQMQRQPLHRQLLGRIFNLALRVILGLAFKDTQCGFKAFTRSAGQTVCQRQKIERWGFDAELLFLARENSLIVKEISVAWSHREATRINPLLDGLHMFGETLRIRWNALTGKYLVPRGSSEPLLASFTELYCSELQRKSLPWTGHFVVSQQEKAKSDNLFDICEDNNCGSEQKAG